MVRLTVRSTVCVRRQSGDRPLLHVHALLEQEKGSEVQAIWSVQLIQLE